MNRKVKFSSVFTAIVLAVMVTVMSCGGRNNQTNQKTNDEMVSEKQKSPSIPVKIAYMEDGKIIHNTIIYLLYQEPDKPTLVEKTANTGNGNEVSFDVPLDKDGASFPFVVLYAKEDVDKAKELTKTSTIRAFRTPPGEKCEFIKITATKGGGAATDGCSIQMWSMGSK